MSFLINTLSPAGARVFRVPLLILTGSTATSIGWVVGGVYFIADMAVISSTGKSITENLFD